jgi:hypothetical protein
MVSQCFKTGRSFLSKEKNIGMCRKGMIGKVDSINCESGLFVKFDIFSQPIFITFKRFKKHETNEIEEIRYYKTPDDFVFETKERAIEHLKEYKEKLKKEESIKALIKIFEEKGPYYGESVENFLDNFWDDMRTFFQEMK